MQSKKRMLQAANLHLMEQLEEHRKEFEVPEVMQLFAFKRERCGAKDQEVKGLLFLPAAL
jgi:hypothetical protein